MLLLLGRHRRLPECVTGVGPLMPSTGIGLGRSLRLYSRSLLLTIEYDAALSQTGGVESLGGNNWGVRCLTLENAFLRILDKRTLGGKRSILFPTVVTPHPQMASGAEDVEPRSASSRS
jgi:hypothetical protein